VGPRAGLDVFQEKMFLAPLPQLEPPIVLLVAYAQYQLIKKILKFKKIN
jgi:hypothetical protein